MPAALVTGSAKGIGKAIVLALAEDGYDVVIHYRSSQKEAAKTAEEARKFGVRAELIQADISIESEAQDLVKTSYQTLGLDILVNNVGNYYRGPLTELSSKDWHEMFNSNLHASFYTCQSAIPLMQKKHFGRIINIGYAGSETLTARPGIVAYGIAKTGVILYSKALAKVNAPYGITVNVVSPGVMDNSITKPIEEIPMGRTGQLSELVAAIRYFLSKEAAYVTGTTLEIAGGWNV